MYSDRWSARLRQGDVVGPVPYPKLKNPPQKILKPAGWAAGAGASHALEFPVDERYAVIVSHDCEFNEAKRRQFLLARVQDFPDSLAPEVQAQLRAANEAVREEGDDPGERYDYLDAFVLDPLPGSFETERVVSFTTIVAFPMTMVGTVREMKKAELKHEHRHQLRQKIAFFFGRGGGDVPDEEKVDAPAA